MGNTGCYGCRDYPNEYMNDHLIVLYTERGRTYQLCDNCISQSLTKYNNLKTDIKNRIKEINTISNQNVVVKELKSILLKDELHD